MATARRRIWKIESAILSLIEVLIDSQDGLVSIGQKVKDNTLKRFFFAESLRRGQFIDELKQLVSLLEPGRFSGSGLLTGTLLRTWDRFRLSFHDNDYALLLKVEQCDLAIEELYESIAGEHLPICFYKILAPQAKHIRMFQISVKLIRDRAVPSDLQPEFVTLSGTDAAMTL